MVESGSDLMNVIRLFGLEATRTFFPTLLHFPAALKPGGGRLSAVLPFFRGWGSRDGGGVAQTPAGGNASVKFGLGLNPEIYYV